MMETGKLSNKGAQTFLTYDITVNYSSLIGKQHNLLLSNSSLFFHSTHTDPFLSLSNPCNSVFKIEGGSPPL